MSSAEIESAVEDPLFLHALQTRGSVDERIPAEMLCGRKEGRARHILRKYRHFARRSLSDPALKNMVAKCETRQQVRERVPA